MAIQIFGADISHHNGTNAVKKCIDAKPEIEFFICKATEGRNFKDERFPYNCVSALEKGKLIGAYHYARPDLGNSWEAEAANFADAVEPFLGNCMLALDWEGKSLNYNDKWALNWCQTVFAITGVKPLVYVQQSALAKMSSFKGKDFGLWVAKWSTVPPVVKNWDFWAMWQFGSTPFDMNVFNGSREQFAMYCHQETVGIEDKENCGCNCCGCSCCNEGE